MKVEQVSPAEKNFVDTSINQLRSYYQETHQMIHQLRRQRFMRMRSRAPRPFQRIVKNGVQSPMSYRFVQTVVGVIAKERPRFTRVPLNRGDRESAERLQRACDPMLQHYESVAREPLYWKFIDQLVADGRGCIKVVKDTWKGFPVQAEDMSEPDFNKAVASFITQGTSHPLRARLVDPLNFLVPPGEYEPSYVIEQGKRQVLPTLKSLDLTIDHRGALVHVPDSTAWSELELPRGLGATMDVEEMWTEEYVYIRMAGNTIKIPNDLGFLPYAYTYGEVSSNPDPMVAATSILYPYHGIEPWLNTMLSTLAAWSIIGGTPILYTTRKPYQGMPPTDAQQAVGDLPLGRRVDLPPGGEIGFVTPPPIGREILDFINMLVDFLDRAGISPLASGIIGTRTPGTTYNTALEAALSKFAPLIGNAEMALADVCKMSWKIVENNLKVPIYVTGMGMEKGKLGVGRKKVLGRYVIDPKDIHEYYDLKCTMKVSNLQDEISRGMHAAFMKSHKLWSRERAMTFSGVDDPFEEWQTGLREELEDSPFIHQQILQQALQADPELAQRATELESQGIDLGALLTGMAQPTTPGGGSGGGGGGGQGGVPGVQGGGRFGGAPQPRGLPAPSAGGKPSGSTKRPGGNRGGPGQGSRGHA